MSDLCDFIPDDPSCSSPDIPDDDHMDHDDHDEEMHDDHSSDMMHGSPMMGNLTYLHVAFFSALHGFLELFVYHGAHDDAADVLPIPALFEGLEMLHHYAHFGLMSILTVTQILSMLGIAVEINIMAWMYAEMIEHIVQLILKVGFMVVYDQAYTIMNDSSSSSADITDATEIAEEIEEHTMVMTIEETSAHLALHLEHENWMMAQVMALPEDHQKKYHGGDDHEKHDDEMMEMVQKYTGYFTI